MIQAELNFTTTSPENIERLSGQNKRLYEYLLSGNKIHCFHEAMRTLRIGYLNSRVSDLRNLHNIEVKKSRVVVQDCNGEDVNVVEYSL